MNDSGVTELIATINPIDAPDSNGLDLSVRRNAVDNATLTNRVDLRADMFLF